MIPERTLVQLIPNFPAIAERFGRWRAFMDERITFSLADSAWHTEAHCERVLLYALSIAQARGASPALLDTLGTVAVFHDARRSDDGLDLEHGTRAAAYYRTFCEDAGMPLNQLSEAVIFWHVPADDEGMAFMRQRFGDVGIEALGIFKDADGLDRFRLGPRGLDPRFLRTPEAHELIDAARTLATRE